MSQIIYVDSDEALNGTPGDFTYQILLNDRYDRVMVLDANIPKSFYLVANGANTFITVENGVSRLLTIPIGNYTAALTSSSSAVSFIVQVLAVLNTGSALVYTASVSAYTNLITFTATGGTWNQLIFPSSSGLYRQFGFAYQSTNTPTAGVLVARSPPVMQLSNVLFIRSNLQECDVQQVSGGILQSISCVNNPNLSSVVYQATINPKYLGKRFNNQQRIYRFWITDADGYSLDLNGCPVNFSLLFFNDDDSSAVLKHAALINNADQLARQAIFE